MYQYLKQMFDRTPSRATERQIAMQMQLTYMLERDAQLLQRIKSFSLDWKAMGSEFLPVVKVEFK